MIKSLKLQNFRRYKDFSINLSPRATIIHADNAEGKSTILEAIHFITNQFSPFTTEIQTLYNKDQEDSPYFRIEIHYNDTLLAHFQDSKKRIFYKDGQKTTKKKFLEPLSSTIFSPEQIERLMLSPERRRLFINYIISKLDADYANNLIEYKKILRQRNAYLKYLAKIFYATGEIPTDDQQLDYWTDKLISSGQTIISKREEYIALLKNKYFKLKYIQSTAIKDFGQGLSDLHRKDIATGHTNLGPQRDDWQINSVENDSKDLRSYGSRGEKRMAIGRLIMRSQELLTDKLGFSPIMLIDDISSELDEKNTEQILKECISKEQQVVITSISLKDIPKSIQDKALIVNLAELTKKE